MVRPSPTSPTSPSRWDRQGGRWKKREADRPTEELQVDDDVERAQDTGEHIDDDVVLPKGLMSSGIGGEGGADATETDMDADATPFDLCSFSASKAELLPAIERQLEGAFRASGMDAGTKDIEDMARCLCSLSAVDVSEIFSPPRFTKMAHLYNLRPGFCIDLTTCLLYTSPSPRDPKISRMPSSA